MFLVEAGLGNLTYTYVCVYIYIYIYIYTHMHICTLLHIILKYHLTRHDICRRFRMLILRTRRPVSNNDNNDNNDNSDNNMY